MAKNRATQLALHSDSDQRETRHALRAQSLEAANLASVARAMHEGAVKAITDKAAIDMQRLNEELAKSNQQLATVNADLEAFSYSVAHDLRGPIRQIAGFSRILVEEYGSLLPSEGRRYLDKVEQGAQHMGVLVDDLLHLARVGRQSLSMQTAALNPIVTDAMDTLRPEYSQRNIEWDIGDLRDANCDPALMRQVFVNLLSNALKYTRPRDPALIQVGQTTQHEERLIFVRDNGVGFDMQYAKKLFGVFERLHTAEEFGGSGIGLATVRRIIQRHGGRVWGEGEPGRGATFFFTLTPNAIAERSAAPEGVELSSRLACSGSH